MIKRQKYTECIKKKYITINIVPTTLQTDNGAEFENNIMNQF